MLENRAQQILHDIRNLTSINFCAIHYIGLKSFFALVFFGPREKTVSQKTTRTEESIRETARNGMKEIFARIEKNVNGIFFSASFEKLFGKMLRYAKSRRLRKYRQNQSCFFGHAWWSTWRCRWSQQKPQKRVSNSWTLRFRVFALKIQQHKKFAEWNCSGTAKISFLARDFFLHFRNSLSNFLLFCSRKSFCFFSHSPFPIKLTFIWISAKIGDRDQIERRKKSLFLSLSFAQSWIEFREKKFHYNFFLCSVRSLWWDWKFPAWKPQKCLFFCVHEGLLWIFPFGCQEPIKKWNLLTRWELWTRRRALLFDLSQQVFVYAFMIFAGGSPKILPFPEIFLGSFRGNWEQKYRITAHWTSAKRRVPIINYRMKKIDRIKQLIVKFTLLPLFTQFTWPAFWLLGADIQYFFKVSGV